MKFLIAVLLIVAACKDKDNKVWPEPNDIRVSESDTISTKEIPITIPDDFAMEVIYDLALVQDYLFSRKDLKYDDVVSISKKAIMKKYELDSLMYIQINLQNYKKKYPFPKPDAYKKKLKTWYFRFVDTLVKK